jgi:hypothetical protein
MMPVIVCFPRCGSSLEYCSASLRDAKVAGQHERQSAPMAATTCVGNAELSDTKLAGFDPEAATDQRHKPPRRRRCPDGFARVADLIDRSGLSRTGLYAELKSNRLPSHEWRGRIVVRLGDFENWLNLAPIPAGTRSPESAPAEGGCHE